MHNSCFFFEKILPLLGIVYLEPLGYQILVAHLLERCVNYIGYGMWFLQAIQSTGFIASYLYTLRTGLIVST